MEVHTPTPLDYHSSLDRGYSRKSSPYYTSKSLNINDGKPITLHPLIIGKDIVLCMPEVNRVLRNVYQVLSQANYYLSKHGISSRRYTGAQLIRIKMLGILGHDAKVCSYILQKDAERIFDSFDMSGNSRKSAQIDWMDPVLLDEKSMPSPTSGKSPPDNADPTNNGPVTIHIFKLGQDVIVCAPDVQKVIQANFNQGATTGYYFTKLGILPYKFTNSAHLDKIKELTIIKRSAVHCTYIMKTDAFRVFEAYGMSEKEIEDKVKFHEIIELGEGPTQWFPPSTMNFKKEDSPSMINSDHYKEGVSPRDSIIHPSPQRTCLSPAENTSDQSSRTSMPTSDDDDEERKTVINFHDMTVNVFIVENQEVVCMPDIHKLVQNIHGNSVQVNYYFNKLKVQKKRFCFAHLRELKSRHILQNNATYCTYVPRADAEKLFQIYCLVGDPKLKEITWTEPINLDSKFTQGKLSPNGGDNEEKEVVVHTFSVENNIVVTTPDVHKIVDFLDEQSASLDYHFRKLGIIKYRFTYSQLHQLRRLNVIKRPTVCTFVSRLDVDRLLSMYETERNKLRILSVKWLPPIMLVHGGNSPSPGKYKTDKSHMEYNDTFACPNQKEEPPKSFEPHSPTLDVPTSFAKEPQSEILSPTSTAMAHIQNIHPSIDCPIVIPNGDYDPMKINDEHEVSASGHVNGKRRSNDIRDNFHAKRVKCKFF